MELRQLEYLVAVADLASFTRAADRLHVAQPGVSAQIRQLERELGEELLDRSGRTVRPTAAGEAVLRYAREALAATEGARLAVDELAGLVHGHVDVGMVVACSFLDLFDLLAAFHHDHPGVEIAVSESNSDQLVDGVRSRELDLAFIGLAGSPPAELELRIVADEPFVAAVRREDPLARAHSVSLATLADRSLIALPPGTGLRTALDDGFAAAKLRPCVAIEASNLNVVAGLAARGLGVAILPVSVAEAHAGELRALAIVRPSLHGQLALAWRRAGPHSPAARALIARAHAVAPVAGGAAA